MPSDNILRYVEKRLDAWCNWYLRHNDFGLGYSKKNILKKLMESGGHSKKTTAILSLPENKEAEEIEKWVMLIAQQTPYLAHALRLHYFEVGTVKSKANKMGVSLTQFKVYINMAKQWLAGRLTASAASR